MPPKRKNTREQIIAAALECVRIGGLEALTAKGIGKELDSAASSIFTHFSSMEELQEETIRAAWLVYDGYVLQGFGESLPLLGFAMQVIRFAGEERNLFYLLFMGAGKQDGIDSLIETEGHREQAMQVIRNTFGLPDDKAATFYRDLWLYTHGIAAATAAGVCVFKEAQARSMLERACRGFLMAIHAVPDQRMSMIPEKDGRMTGTLSSYLTGDTQDNELGGEHT